MAKKIVADNSAVDQLRNALQSLHLNQRIVSSKIIFKELDPTRQRFEPAVSIDSVPYKMADDPAYGPIESISISRVIKYQEEPGHCITSQGLLRDIIKKQYPKFEEIGAEPLPVLNYMKTMEFMNNVVTNSLGSELNMTDFNEWFNELATTERKGELIQEEGAAPE